MVPQNPPRNELRRSLRAAEKPPPDHRRSPPLARHLRALIALAATIIALASTIRSESETATSFSDASLNGTYLVTTTVKPYVKFGGGPQVGGGELRFDGRGGVSGETTFFDERQKVRGTYHVNADGTGTMNYTTNPPTEPQSVVELQLRILSSDKVEFQSPGLQNRDWSSANNLLHENNAGLVGEFRRKSD